VFASAWQQEESLKGSLKELLQGKDCCESTDASDYPLGPGLVALFL
jgi:hypothetical protein